MHFILTLVTFETSGRLCTGIAGLHYVLSELYTPVTSVPK